MRPDEKECGCLCPLELQFQMLYWLLQYVGWGFVVDLQMFLEQVFTRRVEEGCA